MVRALEVAEELRRLDRGSSPLRVFWVTVSGERDVFAQQLRGALTDVPVVCVVVRRAGFREPNAVMHDVLSAIRDCQEQIQQVEDLARTSGGVDVVLVGRREWQLVDSSSPLDLPEWFPVDGGRTATVQLIDLTWSARVALDHPGVGLDDLRRILYELDTALLNVLERTRERDYRELQPLWQRLGMESAGDRAMREELARVRDVLEDVGNPTKYRPSTVRDATLVGHLWSHTNKTSPDNLRRTADALAQALRVTPSQSRGVSFTGVLNRPTNPIEDVVVRWLYGLLGSVRAACQLVTAAAHADRYPQFPSVLLKSTSLDIRQFLNVSVGVLQTRNAHE